MTKAYAAYRPRTRFSGLLLARKVDGRQFEPALEALRECLNGAHVNSWQTTDILQGKLLVDSSTEKISKYHVLRESLGILSVGKIAAVYPAESDTSNTQKIWLKLDGEGVADLKRERERIYSVTHQKLSKQIYLSVGSLSVYDAQAFYASLSDGMLGLDQVLPKVIAIDDLDIDGY